MSNGRACNVCSGKKGKGARHGSLLRTAPGIFSRFQILVPRFCFQIFPVDSVFEVRAEQFPNFRGNALNIDACRLNHQDGDGWISFAVLFRSLFCLLYLEVQRNALVFALPFRGAHVLMQNKINANCIKDGV